MPMTFSPAGTDVDDVALADLGITQGDDLSIEIEVTDDGTVVPLTGYEAMLQVRDDYGAIVLTFDSQATPATIVITEATGLLTLTQLAATTTALTPGRYTWDLELIDAEGLISTEARGTCIIRAQAARRRCERMASSPRALCGRLGLSMPARRAAG
jgi:hypothetical protein